MHKGRFYRHPCRWHRDQKRTSESGYIISDTEEKVGASKEKPREKYLALVLQCTGLDLKNPQEK